METSRDDGSVPTAVSASLGWPIGSIFLGIVIAILAYANRPPSNAGEALGMLLQGRQHFISPALYATLLVMAAGFTVYGVARTVSGVTSKQSDATRPTN